MTDHDTDATATSKPRKIEFEYLDSGKELSIKVGSGDDYATNYFPLSGSQKIKLAMELLGHGNVSTMVAELEEKREALIEAQASLMQLHREWMVQHVELNASQAECAELRKLYLEEGEKEVSILSGSAVQG